MISTAIQYAERGFYVLPLTEDKKPLIKFADKPPLTEQEIRDVWNQYPSAQIGLRTVQFFVVDIDTKEEHGADGYKSIEQLNLPDTLTQTTPSGGKQLFYKKPKDIPITQNIGILPGVDIKAQNNNYVMVSPSVRNGKSYEWVNELPMNEPSKELIELITKNKINKTRRNDSFLIAHYQNEGSGVTNSKIIELFSVIANGLGDQGQRNNKITQFVGSLLYIGVGSNEVYELLQIANSNTIDKLCDEEINKSFISILEREIKQRKELLNE